MTDKAEQIAAGRICEMCGAEFRPPAYRVARGHGKTCSRSCAAKKAAAAFAKSRPKPTDTEIVAFLWENVGIRGERECWPWTRSANVKGRGMLSFRGVRVLAPRAAWFAKTGEWPKPGVFVCHTCDNPACCNPAHLWLGSPGDNSRDMVRKGRGNMQRLVLTECLRGHAYTPENTYTDRRGRRACKTCRREANRRYSRRRKVREILIRESQS